MGPVILPCLPHSHLSSPSRVPPILLRGVPQLLRRKNLLLIAVKAAAKRKKLQSHLPSVSPPLRFPAAPCSPSEGKSFPRAVRFRSSSKPGRDLSGNRFCVPTRKEISRLLSESISQPVLIVGMPSISGPEKRVQVDGIRFGNHFSVIKSSKKALEKGICRVLTDSRGMLACPLQFFTDAKVSTKVSLFGWAPSIVSWEKSSEKILCARSKR